MSDYTTSQLTYYIEKFQSEGRGLFGEELDNNFRLLFYSASLQDDGATLRLHRDINDQVRNTVSGFEDFANPPDRYTPHTEADFVDIAIGGGGGSGVTILGNQDSNIITATGNAGELQGEAKFTFNSTNELLTLTGSVDLDSAAGCKNIFIGKSTNRDDIDQITTVGYLAGANLTNNRNVLVGTCTLNGATNSTLSAIVGLEAFKTASGGNCNTALGACAGVDVSSGDGNVLIGHKAGPSSTLAISNKLYINNDSGTPLILGDFSTGHVEIKTALSASTISGSFFGDGTNLTGINTSAFPFNGDAVITGSLTVSGSSVVVDLTDTLAISGSIFSGSFVGDGSGLTNITSTGEWDGSRDGDANITGSFVVSGSSPTIDLKGDTTIDTNIKIHNPVPSSLGIGAVTLNTTTTGTNNVALGYRAACKTAAASSEFVAIGSEAGREAGSNTVYVGYLAGGSNTSTGNVALGSSAMGSSAGSSTTNNIAIGNSTLNGVNEGTDNIAIGDSAGTAITSGDNNITIGSSAASTLSTGVNNVILGSTAGAQVTTGQGNVFIGHQAAQDAGNISNKLYINNSSGTPLILGDFTTNEIEFAGGVTGSFSGSFTGDGTNLTGVTAEWDGSRNGDANITGSFVVSGSGENVDFTNAEGGVSGSFSGSFVGDGSGLTGITDVEWDGTRNGDSNITGSLIVSGALDVGGTLTIASGSYPGGPGVELIQVNGDNLNTDTTLYSFAIDASTGYTGFKADYVLTTGDETSKKVGTILGSWDRAGNSVVNEEHTLASGLVTGTSFEVDSSDTNNAIFKVIIPGGTFEINALITAFKRTI